MTARLLTAEPIARGWKQDLLSRAGRLRSRGLPPRLLLAAAGDAPSLRAYRRSIERAGAEAGIEVVARSAAAGAPAEAGLLAVLAEGNTDPSIHGILVLTPLPAEIRAERILSAVDPAKDADGTHPLNCGRLFLGQPGFVPPTAVAAVEILSQLSIDLAGKEAVVVGRSPIVGRPLALLLLHRHAIPTWCHSRAPDLGAITRRGELLFVAVGKPGLVTASMVRPGAVVVDVGTNVERLRDAEGNPLRDAKGRVRTRLAGDVAFDEVAAVASAITPVPGGVGPLTTLALLRNVVAAAENTSGDQSLRESM